MDKAGPPLEALTRRLLETPAAFLGEPCICATAHSGAQVVTAALVNDVLYLHGARAAAPHLQRFEGVTPRADRNRLALVAITAWLLADAWFLEQGLDHFQVLYALAEVPEGLAPVTAAHRFVRDPDRRAELARTVLAQLGYRPGGETAVQAADRLQAVSGAARRALVEASRAAEQRARKIRAALEAQAAQESADKWTRE
ncbi:MAG TPA: hypothetical protein VF663_05575 [Telluria sp.]|jgi:hypothetical protein